MSNATDRDVWPRILREVAYALYTPCPAPLALVDSTFSGVIDHPENVARRSRFLAAIRAALDSNIDIAAELGFAHPDSVVREFLVAVEKRLRDELGE